ncbi:MAG: hypothetical protein COA79_26255 [Planctomycetota bacterium]|nr:MAG: hypothetical protein COA79_26255 [Planctomycetota bacterium]
MNISIKDLQAKINDGFSNHILEFKYKKTEFEYSKKINDIVQFFCIELTKKTDWYIIEPSVSFGAPEVNKIFNIANNRENAVGGFTVGFTLRNKYQNKRGHYVLDDGHKLNEIIKKLIKDYEDIASEFYLNIQTLDQLEFFMNQDQNGFKRLASVSDGCSKLIASKLCKRDYFNELFDFIYKDSLAFFGEELSEPILNTHKYLIEMN